MDLVNRIVSAVRRATSAMLALLSVKVAMVFAKLIVRIATMTS